MINLSTRNQQNEKQTTDEHREDDSLSLNLRCVAELDRCRQTTHHCKTNTCFPSIGLVQRASVTHWSLDDSPLWQQFSVSRTNMTAAARKRWKMLGQVNSFTDPIRTNDFLDRFCSVNDFSRLKITTTYPLCASKHSVSMFAVNRHNSKRNKSRRTTAHGVSSSLQISTIKTATSFRSTYGLFSMSKNSSISNCFLFSFELVLDEDRLRRSHRIQQHRKHLFAFVFHLDRPTSEHDSLLDLGIWPSEEVLAYYCLKYKDLFK